MDKNEFKTCLNNVIVNLKKFDDLVAESGQSSNTILKTSSCGWDKVVCMIDGGYELTARDKFDWFRTSAISQQAVAEAIRVVRAVPDTPEKDADAIEMLSATYQSFHKLSTVLLASLKNAKL
jgi:hypothetical protein